jgi:hypothetical protein
LDDFLTIHLRQWLILGKAKEYSQIAKAFQPLTLTIP